MNECGMTIVLGTLLNRLFGTSFDVMSETARQQTTKGIWMSKDKDKKILIMDVEGTDGRERGEDQVCQALLTMFLPSSVKGQWTKKRLFFTVTKLYSSCEQTGFRAQKCIVFSRNNRSVDREHVGTSSWSVQWRQHGSSQDRL
jgi:hypothetical protein